MRLFLAFVALSVLFVACEKPVEEPAAEPAISYPVKYAYGSAGNPSTITAYTYSGKLSSGGNNRCYNYDPLKNPTPQMTAEDQDNLSGKLTLLDSSRYQMTNVRDTSVGFYSRTDEFIILSNVKKHGVLYLKPTSAGLEIHKYYVALPEGYPDVKGYAGQLGRKTLDEVVTPLVGMFDTCAARTYTLTWKPL